MWRRFPFGLAVRRLPHGLAVAGLASLGLGLSGCDASNRDKPHADAANQDPETTEPSPNAKILPDPLKGSQVRASEGAGGVSLTKQPLSVDRPLREEESALLPALGYEFGVEFALPEVRRGLELEARAERAHAGFLVEVLPEALETVGARRARQRLRLSGSLFVLPEGTELRSQADRYGFIVVWPDGRSYRTVPRDALSALFQERRVDVMPPFDAIVLPPEALERDKRKLLRRRVKSPLGELGLVVSEEPEWGPSTTLFCEVLLELLRVRANDEFCRPGELAIEFRFGWAEGGELRGVTTPAKRRSDLDPAAFALPPQMSIFKPGELPPDADHPWSDSELRSLFPRGSGPALSFKNTLEVPLLLLIDGLPALRLDPDQEWQFSPTRGGFRYQARDFFGQHVRSGGNLNAPAWVLLGLEPEVRDTPPVVTPNAQ